MSTIVEMPVRVNPPPAETGETISPGWASFEIATPSNGARMIVSSGWGWGRVGLGWRRVDVGLADHALGEELVAPPERQQRLVQAHLALVRGLTRRLELRAGQLEARAGPRDGQAGRD